MKTLIVNGESRIGAFVEWVCNNSEDGDTLAILTPDEIAAMKIPDAVIDAATWVLQSDNVDQEEIDRMAAFIVNLRKTQHKGGA